MPPTERARTLSRKLRARFRIDLYSCVAERDFERQLADAIRAAEEAAFHRGQEFLRHRLEWVARECEADGRDVAEGIETALRAPPKEGERAA